MTTCHTIPLVPPDTVMTHWRKNAGRLRFHHNPDEDSRDSIDGTRDQVATSDEAMPYYKLLCVPAIAA